MAGINILSYMCVDTKLDEELSSTSLVSHHRLSSLAWISRKNICNYGILAKASPSRVHLPFDSYQHSVTAYCVVFYLKTIHVEGCQGGILYPMQWIRRNLLLENSQKKMIWRKSHKSHNVSRNPLNSCKRCLDLLWNPSIYAYSFFSKVRFLQQ